VQQINRSLLGRGRDHKIQLSFDLEVFDIGQLRSFKNKSLMPLMKNRPIRKTVDRILCNYRKLSIVSTSLLLLNFGLGRDETRRDSAWYRLESRTNVSVSSRHGTYQTRSRLVSKFETRRDREKSRLVRNTILRRGRTKKLH